ncbi:mercury resistance system periplasmic binding protein MerP [Acidithiobacillus sp. IBUN Pt1247-S3]|uniref:mercury resistance system periplasmic binding protein MerP n=1 Tax=Acidithiobacillus sp. IBUN Pt1247-S3 TaxID=3166642 RepID=UPI0034E3C411
MKKLLAALALIAVTAPAWAATQTVTLSIPGMTCGACPITVRTALDRVPGVEKVVIDEAQKLVTVSYDDSKTDAQALTKATKDAGYPSSVKH